MENSLGSKLVSKNLELVAQQAKAVDWLRAAKDTVLPSDKKARAGVDALQREELRKLIQRLFFMSTNGSAPRTVVFCGIDRAEGSAWVCAHCSEILAGQHAGSVCILDANVRSPLLHAYFGVEKTRGLSDWMREAGPIQHFAQMVGENLWLVPGGSNPQDLANLLGRVNLSEQFSELRRQFNYVLINASPVNPYNEALLVGRIADGVVLVLEANATRKAAARKAKETAELANVRLLGAVLNQRTFPIPEALYRRL